MPTYEYRCADCGEHIEVVQSFSDDSLTTCALCQGDLKKVFHPVGVVFKGSGFYVNDSRSSKAQSTPSKSESNAGESGSGESGSKEGASKDSGSGEGASKDSGSKKGDSKSGSGTTSTDTAKSA